MRILFLAALLSCSIRALAMTDAERMLISAAAQKAPTGRSNQEAVDTVRRLGSAGDLEALDLLISVNHWSLVGDYVSGYRAAPLGKDPAPLEHRLLAQYANPRMAVTLMRGIDKYASPAVLDRLLGDATRLAKAYADEAKRCKIAMVQEYPPSKGLGPRAEPQSIAQLELAAATEGRAKVPGLDCVGPAAPVDQERSRMWEAVRMLGKTDRTDAASRIQPLLAALTATPLPRNGEAAVMMPAWMATRVLDLHSIAGLIGRRQYPDAGADLVATVRKMSVPARTERSLEAVWPLLQALARLDRLEGTEAIAEWIEWRSASKSEAAMTPPTADMVRLLGHVLPEAQVDVTALRRRVMPRVPDAQRVDYEKAFDAAEKANQELRDPKEVTLIGAALQNNPRMVRYVLSRGITPNAHDATGDTALTAIAGYAQKEHLEVCTILIDAGADPDGPGRDGMTPFHHAVASFNPLVIEPYKMLDFWYAQKADVNRVAGQATPLWTAAGRSTDLVKYLLERGAKTEIAGRDGLTPLHAAVIRNKVEIVKQLLAAGARVGAKDDDDRMPLHFAVSTKSVESVELLLKAGADVNAEIKGGLTPLLMAQDSKYPAMEALLRHHGGRINLSFKAKRAALMMLYRSGGH